MDGAKIIPVARSNKTQLQHMIIGGGIMGDLIRSFNWSKTSLGPITSWQQSLLYSVNIILQSPVPMVILWGTDGIMIYNDAYADLSKSRHPSILGSKVLEGWPEAADFNRNVLKIVLSGKTLTYKDHELTLLRHNKAEKLWFNLNYSPIFDSNAKPAGVLAVVVETTQRMLIEKKQSQTEESLNVERFQFKIMANNISNLAWMADANGWIYWFNSRWYEYTGTTPKDMEGWGWQSVHDPIMLPKVLKMWKKSIKNGEPFEMVFPLLGADGVFRQFLTRVSPVNDNAGVLKHWFGTNTDITEQLESKERQHILSDQIDSILESMGDAFIILDSDFNIVRVNKLQEKLSRMKRKDTIGKNLWKIFPEIANNKNKYWTEYHRVVKTGKPAHFTDHYAPLDLWTEVDAYPTNQGGISIFFRDVSGKIKGEIERQNLLEALKTEKNRLAEALEFAPAFLAVLEGQNLTYTMANKSYYQLVGYRDIIGKSLLEALPEVRGQGYKELLDKVYKTGKPFIGKALKVMLQPSPESELVERFVDIVYRPMKDLKRKTIGIYAFGYDVTELIMARKLIEESKIALTDSEVRFRTLIEKSTDAIQLIDTTGKIIYSSASIKNVLGYTIEELQGSGFAPYLHPDDSKNFYLKIAELIKHPKKPVTLQYRVKHKDGSWAWLETTGVNHLRTPTIQALVGTFRNITDRKLAEVALKQQLQITNAITDIATACLFMIDGNGIVTFMNPSAQTVTGYTQEDVIGKPMHSLVHHSHPDGTPYPESECPLVSTYKYGEPNPLHEDIFYRKNGSSFDALIIGTPIPGAQGMQGTVVEFRDISEEKQAQKELRELITITEQRNALIKINKTKDEFIGMASHQLRTPATAVKQYIGLLMNEFAGPISDEQSHYLKVAYDSNERELKIIDDLLKTALISADNYRLDKKAHDLAELIDECIVDLTITFEQKQQVAIFKKPFAALEAFLDRTEMKLALINLLENASKYSYPNTEIQIVLTKNEKYIEITITDEGVGISKDNQQRIFDKFTRVDNELSDTVSGTGLGLYWVKQIIKLHKGSIELESAIRKGSTFTVRLPQ